MHSFMCCYKNKVQLKADENNNRESKQTTFKRWPETRIRF